MSEQPSELLARRTLLRGAGAALVLPFTPSLARSTRGPWRAGFIADLHHGLEPTAQKRIEAFVEAATERRVNAIVQLGDFNFGTAENALCMQTWNSFEGEKQHVLGNHDMDKVTKPEVMDFWGMAARYSSFDRGGFHFVILDRNHLRTEDGDVPYAKGNYFAHPGARGHADREQLEWLKTDLEATKLPTVVLVHQGVGMVDDLPESDPRAEIEGILHHANRDGRARVVACFCGHEHLDRYRQKDGVHYVWMNSASYYWVGSKYGRMAPYADPLFAFVTFDPNGAITIEGRASSFTSPTPAERGFPRADEVSASISDRSLCLPER